MFPTREMNQKVLTFILSLPKKVWHTAYRGFIQSFHPLETLPSSEVTFFKMLLVVWK